MDKIRYRLVYNRRKLLNNQGAALIQVEASLNKRKVYFTTRIYVRPDEWDTRTSTVVNHPQAIELNAWLYEFLINMQGFELAMWKRGIVPTLLQLKEAVKNNHSSDLTFETFSMSAITRSSRKIGTKNNLQGTLKALNEFRPGNIRITKDKWQGLRTVQTDKEFFQFEEMKWGYRALIRTLQNYRKRHGCRTITEFIQRWAPSCENNTMAYIKSICNQLGVPSVFVPDIEDRDTMCAFAAAISLHENGVEADMKEVQDGWDLL